MFPHIDRALKDAQKYGAYWRGIPWRKPMPDPDGYPTDEEEKRIAEWPGLEKASDYSGLMEYVRSLWMYADIGYFQEKNGIYFLHTGGWSGNENLIHALRDNTMFWMMCWVSSRRGGHFEFQVVAPEGVEVLS